MKQRISGLAYALTIMALASLNIGLVATHVSAEESQIPYKRVCAYVGDPNPECTECGGGMCWDCEQDCDWP